MTNLLTKDTRTTYTPGTPGVPSNPGQPYRPAYTSYETQLVCGLVQTGGSYQWVLVDGQYQYMFVPTGSVGSAYYTCREESVPVYHPEQPYVAPTAGVPPTPAQMTEDLNIGWNAGARSIVPLRGPGEVSFKLPKSKGVAVGLRTIPQGADPYLNADRTLLHGFVKVDTALPEFSATAAVRVYDGGAYTGVSGSDSAVYKIVRRADGTAAYYIDDVLVHTGTSTSNERDLYLVAVMYAGSDTVDEPEILAHDPQLAFEPMTMSAGDAALGGANVSFEPLAADIRDLDGASASFEPLAVMASDTAYAGADAGFEPLSLSAGEDGRGYLVNAVSGSLAFMTVSANLSDGGGLDISFEPLAAAAGDAYAFASGAAFEPMYAEAGAFEGNENASFFGVGDAQDTSLQHVTMQVALISSADAAPTLASVVFKDAAAVSSAGVEMTLATSLVLEALMQSTANVWAGVPVLTDQGDVWVVNEDGASSMYENYSFNSFGFYQGHYFGAKADGLYLLEGDTDAGDLVRASISLGKQDFGTTLAKTVTDCYIGVAADGNVWLKLLANDKTYLYRTRRSTDYLDVQRIKPALGIKANYITFELYNDTGADFELASVEFQAAVLSRRI